MITPRFSNPRSDRRRLLVRTVAITAAAAIFGVLSMSGTAAPGGGGGGGGKPKRDTTPPTVTVSISQQTAASVVVSGSASDNVAVTEVDVAVDGGAYAVVRGTTTWSYTVDATTLAAGSHDGAVHRRHHSAARGGRPEHDALALALRA